MRSLRNPPEAGRVRSPTMLGISPAGASSELPFGRFSAPDSGNIGAAGHGWQRQRAGDSPYDHDEVLGLDDAMAIIEAGIA